MCSNIHSPLYFSVRLSLTGQDKAQQYSSTAEHIITKRGKSVTNCHKSEKYERIETLGGNWEKVIKNVSLLGKS